VVSGVWHGANWTFVLWGTFHGLFLVIDNVKSRYLGDKQSDNKFVKIINTVSCFAVVCFAWIFFRADSAQQAFFIIKKIFTNTGPLFDFGKANLVYSFVGITILFIREFYQEYYPTKKIFMESKNIIWRYITYITLVSIILTIGVFSGGQFIYFQF